MKKLVTFFSTFWKSISSFGYYRDVVKAPFSFSLKYFLVFSLLLGTILTISISLAILKPLNTFITRMNERALTLYPHDLVITLTNGELSTNVPEPLHFPFPFELFFTTPPAISDQKQMYLVTIDTSADIQDHVNSQSIIFITKKHLVVRSGEDDFEVYPLRDFGDITLDKASFDSTIQKVLPLLQLLPMVTVVSLFIILTVIVPLIRLLSLLFLTPILMLVSFLMQLKLSFTTLFQLGLHALTLPTLIQVGMTSLGLFPPFPFFTSLLFLLYMLIVLAELAKPHVSAPTSDT